MKTQFIKIEKQAICALIIAGLQKKKFEVHYRQLTLFPMFSDPRNPFLASVLSHMIQILLYGNWSFFPLKKNDFSPRASVRRRHERHERPKKQAKSPKKGQILMNQKFVANKELQNKPKCYSIKSKPRTSSIIVFFLGQR